METVQPIRNLEDIERMRTVLAKSGSRNRLLFDLGVKSGLRISDILSLKVGDVRGKDRISITEQKTGKSRPVSLNGVQSEIADEIIGMSDDQYLFSSRKHKDGNRPITRIQAYRILNDAAKVCGLNEIGTHTLRKTFGYHFYNRTHDVAMLQKLLNHSSPSITLRYIGIEADQMNEALDSFII